MKFSPKKPKLINHPALSLSYRRYHDDDDFNDDYLILGLGFGIWGIYWGIIHLIDKFTFNFMPWWVEPFTVFPLVGLVALAELYGRNPLHWWPLVWGTKIKVSLEDDPVKHTLEIEEIIGRMGGPANVYVVDWETLKFRRKKDVTKYLLFLK